MIILAGSALSSSLHCGGNVCVFAQTRVDSPKVQYHDSYSLQRRSRALDGGDLEVGHWFFDSSDFSSQVVGQFSPLMAPTTRHECA